MAGCSRTACPPPTQGSCRDAILHQSRRDQSPSRFRTERSWQRRCAGVRARRSLRASISQRPVRSANYLEGLNPISPARCLDYLVKDVPVADLESDLALPLDENKGLHRGESDSVKVYYVSMANYTT